MGPAESVLATIESDQELGSSPVSTPFRDRSLMEALLAQKMAQAAKVPSIYYVNIYREKRGIRKLLYLLTFTTIAWIISYLNCSNWR